MIILAKLEGDELVPSDNLLHLTFEEKIDPNVIQSNLYYHLRCEVCCKATSDLRSRGAGGASNESRLKRPPVARNGTLLKAASRRYNDVNLDVLKFKSVKSQVTAPSTQ